MGKDEKLRPTRQELRTLMHGFMRRYRALEKDTKRAEALVKQGAHMNLAKLAATSSTLESDMRFVVDNKSVLGFFYRIVCVRFLQMIQYFNYMRVKIVIDKNEQLKPVR